MIAYHLTLYEQAKRSDAPINWYLPTIYAVSIHHYYFYVNWSCLSIIIFQTLLCTIRFFFNTCAFIDISLVYLLFFYSNQHLPLEPTLMVLHKQQVSENLSCQTFKGAKRLLSTLSTENNFTFCKTSSMRKILIFVC